MKLIIIVEKKKGKEKEKNSGGPWSNKVLFFGSIYATLATSQWITMTTVWNSEKPSTRSEIITSHQLSLVLSRTLSILCFIMTG